ncbi:hypothetical protein KKC45_03870, partial [Patescibacteria group bacterium]|nr:hypothetical protein [Patescibacteria group bacterium]
VILFAFTMLLAPAVSGAEQEQKGIHEPGTGLENTELKEEAQGTGQGLQNEVEGEATTSLQQRNGEEKGMFGENAELRRSRIANSVQEMEMIATRNQGVEEQIRVIAQNQNQIQEDVEEALQTAQKRGGFAKFFVGPNYGQLKDIETRLENHTQNLAELKNLREQIMISADKELIDQQIAVMEKVKAELEEAVNQEKKGFSLFGWLNRIISK